MARGAVYRLHRDSIDDEEEEEEGPRFSTTTTMNAPSTEKIGAAQTMIGSEERRN